MTNETLLILWGATVVGLFLIGYIVYRHVLISICATEEAFSKSLNQQYERWRKLSVELDNQEYAISELLKCVLDKSKTYRLNKSVVNFMGATMTNKQQANKLADMASGAIVEKEDCYLLFFPNESQNENQYNTPQQGQGSDSEAGI